MRAEREASSSPDSSERGVHLLACLGQQYDPALLTGGTIHDSSYAAALRHFENLNYKFLLSGSEVEDWVAAPRLCVDFATLWVTLHVGLTTGSGFGFLPFISATTYAS